MITRTRKRLSGVAILLRAPHLLLNHKVLTPLDSETDAMYPPPIDEEQIDAFFSQRDVAF